MELSQQNRVPRNYVLCEICENQVERSSSENTEIACSTCGHRKKQLNQAVERTLFFSLTALILYFPANMLPFMTLEMYGNKNEATIWSGIVSLAKEGSYFIAGLVFLASMVVPFIKLASLLYISISSNKPNNRKFKTSLFKFIDAIGPWSMLDIFLVAIFVAIVKFDSMADVTAGPGAAVFLLVVIFSMLASKNYNPKMIWEKNEKQ